MIPQQTGLRSPLGSNPFLSAPKPWVARCPARGPSAPHAGGFNIVGGTSTIGYKKTEKEGKTDYHFYDRIGKRWIRDQTPILYLLDRGTEGVKPIEALQKVQEEGAVLLDVRTQHSAEPTMEGAVRIPLFKPNEGKTAKDQLKKMLTAFVMVAATEPNPDFRVEVSKLDKDKPIIVACNRGGRIGMPGTTDVKGVVVNDESELEKLGCEVADGTIEIGIDTNSLAAAKELYELGFTNVYYMKGGINQWQIDGLPMTGDPDMAQPAIH
jgi:rhodanese-related sulfurtransferase